MTRVYYDIVTVAANTSTGVQTITGSLGGLTPKGVIIMASRGTTTGTQADGALVSVGFTDGTNQRVVAAMAEDGVAFGSADAGRHFANDKLVILTGTADETIDGEADFDSFSANSVGIDWTNAPSFAAILVVVFIYGEDAQCYVGNYAGATTAVGDTTTVSGLPFKPRWLMGIHQVAVFNSGGAGTGGSARGGFGFCSFDNNGTVRQGCTGWMDRDGGGTLETVCAQVIRSNRFAANVVANANGSVSEVVTSEITSVTPDGFVATTQTASGVALNVGYLAVYTGDLRAWVGTPTVTTSSMGVKALGTAAFRSQMLGAIGTAVQTLDSVTATTQASHFSIGFARATEEGSVGYQVEDAAATSDTRSLQSAELISIPGDSGGIIWSAALSSFGSNDASINVTNDDASDCYSVFLALETPFVVSSDTENITDQHALAVGLAQSETENLTDQHAMTVGMALSEEEDITDEVVLVSMSISNQLYLVLTESVEIDDQDLPYPGYVLLADDSETITDGDPVMTGVMALSEEVDLTDGVYLSGTALLVISEMVELSESAAMYLGMLLALSDTENITDEFSFGRGLIATHGTARGTTLQGGPESGVVLGPHAERGTTLGG